MQRELRLLNNKHCVEYLQFLSKNHLSFNLLCERDAIDFSPKLPKEIHEKFGSLVLFILAGYTLESLMIDAQSVQFEAGFGPNNIGSVVQVGLSGIIQILIKEKMKISFYSIVAIRLNCSTKKSYLSKSQRKTNESLKNGWILKRLFFPIPKTARF